MTHEFKKIVNAFQKATQEGKKCVMATVVALDGSSYRRPGVRMLLVEDGAMIGAVSGGCVEKEVFRQAESVFKNGTPKVMTYDGRYRLGCEGILYILLEPIHWEKQDFDRFHRTLELRNSFTIHSYYQKKYAENVGYGSILTLNNEERIPLRPSFSKNENSSCFEQIMKPCLRLVLLGAEHDTVELCGMGAKLGWDVTVVVPSQEEKTMPDFPGASSLISSDGEELQLQLDQETAVVLMTHSLVKDLKYLRGLRDQKPLYFGLLGPARRREKLFEELIELHPDIDVDFLEQVHGPAGLDIGAETPQEIALAILAEIVGVLNQKEIRSLKKKKGRIHA